MTAEEIDEFCRTAFADCEPADVIPIFRAAEQRSSTSREIAQVRVSEERRGKYR